MASSELKPKSKRGGTRPGAGRPPIGDAAMVVVSVRVPSDVADAIRADGAGARAALGRWAKRTTTKGGE